MVKVEINFSNKFVYLVVAVAAVLVVTGFAIAVLGEVPSPGHPVSELQPCDDGETLVMVNGAWECGSSVAGSLSCISSGGIPSGSSGDDVCAAMGAGYVCTSVAAVDQGGYGNAAAICQWVSNSAGTYKATCCKIV